MKAQRCRILIALVCILTSFEGCATIGIGLLYKKAALPESQIVRNIQYSDTPDSDPRMNRLDLFLPQASDGEGWPTLIFVHGGGWSEGDKDLKVAGADVYGNIGRFFATQGVATAVISYRLMPQVDWKAQVLDVARATAWIYKHIHEYHGDPHAIFLAGHSAGAQIASRVALDRGPLNSLGLSPSILCGVIPISGVGYDFMNQEMYEYGKDQGTFQTLFHKDDLSKKMRKKLSPIFFVKEASPPFLILYAAKDPKEMKHASQRLEKALIAVGARTQIYEVPKVDHKSMILALSHSNKMPATLIMVFMRASSCGGAKE